MTGRPELRVFISVEMEGISGVVHTSQTRRDQPDYAEGRALMAGDLGAAVEGALEAGATEVIVADGHAAMRNLRFDQLPEQVVLVRGSPRPLGQMAGIDAGCAAALFVGFHARKGTLRGVLDHTILTRSVDSVVINGEEVGEIAMSAAIAGRHGVPLVFVSGDLAVTREAEQLVPGIATVAVKEGISRTAARCLHPRRARELIRRGVAEGLERRGAIAPFTFEPPIEALVRYTNAQMADAVELMPGAARVDGRTVRLRLDDYLEAVDAIKASVLIASAVSGGS